MPMPGLARPYLTLVTILPPPRIKKTPPLMSPKPVTTAFAPPRGRLSQQVERQVSDLEDRLGWFTMACSLGFKYTVYTLQIVQDGVPTLTQLANRRRGTQLLHELTEKSRYQAFLANSLCSSWTWRRAGLGATGAQSSHSDIVALVASVYAHIKLHRTPEREGPHTLPDLLRHLRRTVERCTSAIPARLESQVVHQEAFLLQQVGFELATLAPSEWIEICVISLLGSCQLWFIAVLVWVRECVLRWCALFLRTEHLVVRTERAAHTLSLSRTRDTLPTHTHWLKCVPCLS